MNFYFETKTLNGFPVIEVLTVQDGANFRETLFPDTDLTGKNSAIIVYAQSVFTSDIIADYEAYLDANAAPVTPNWRGFVKEFTNIAAANYEIIYAATATAVQASPENVKEHWANIRMGLTSQVLTESEFQSSAEGLNQMLITAGNPLSQATKDAWVALAASYNISLVLS